MKRSFDEVLNECLQELEASGGQIDALVGRYPEHAAELRRHLAVWSELARAEKAQATPQGAMWGRQRLLSALVERRERVTGLADKRTGKEGFAMRYVMPFVVGAAVALGIALLTGNLNIGSDSGPVEADELPACLESLDLNGDGQLTVDDVLLFKGAIESQDPAFDFNGDTVVDIHDAVTLVQEVVACFEQQQPPPPSLP